MQQRIRPINQHYSICQHKLLGKGSTGDVFLGFRNNDSSFKVAIKSIDLSTINNEVTRYLLSCEIAALSNLGHDNIVKLMDIVIERNHLYLIMELLEGGTLSDYIKEHPNGLPEEEAIHIFRQIIEGYSCIKNKKIVHRDLKPDNILFKRNPKQSKQVAIIDFGYCEMEEVPNKPNMFYNVGSPKYMSPEAFKDNRYSEKSDIWAIGVMLYEMLVGSTCDKGMSMDAYLQMLARRGVPIPQKLRMFHQHLISTMLAYNHHQRTGIDRIRKELQLNHSSQESMERQNSQLQLRTTLKNQPNHGRVKQVLFHSLILPDQRQAMAMREKCLNEKGLRSESKIAEPNQNKKNARNQRFEAPRVNGLSFHVQNVRPQEQPQILGRVQNVDLDSAKQLVHRRPVEQERRYQEIKNSQQLRPQLRPMLPKQSTMIALPTTPMTQSNTFPSAPFFQGPNRQMTPMAGQHIHIPNQSNQPIKNSQFIVPSYQKQVVHHQRPYFDHNPHQQVRPVNLMQPTAPGNFHPSHPQPLERIVQRPENQEQYRSQGLQGPQVPQHPQTNSINHSPIIEKKGSLKQLQPSRFRVTINGPPQNINRISFEPERRQSPFKHAPQPFYPVQRRPEPVRVNTFQHFQPIPQVMNLRVNTDNRQKFTRIVPQNYRQPQYRNIVPQHQMQTVRQIIK